MKLALVHDQLQEFGGAERVLIALHTIFPNAPVYTAFYNEDSLKKNVPDYKDWKIKVSWAHYVPLFKKLYSPLRFLAPAIWESFDFKDFDVVLSSSGWYMCKGIKVKKPTIHVSYLHHPPRYLYGYETAVEWQKYWPVKIYASVVNHFLRQWDYSSSQHVDHFIANSEETKRRIEKFYRKDSKVLYPPVSIPPKATSYKFQATSYYVTVSRLARAKHIDLLIQTANEYKFNLKIVGSGRDLDYLRSIAGGTVEFITDASDEKRNKLIADAKAFLFASVDEEFGIAPVEAMGFGTPVIAYASGGLKETIKDNVNGFLFNRLSTEAVQSSIKKLESLSDEKYLEMRKKSRKESEQYSFENFKTNLLSFVNSL